MKKSSIIVLAIGIGVIVLALSVRFSGPKMHDVRQPSKPTAEQPKPEPFPYGSKARLIYEDNDKVPVYRYLTDMEDAIKAIRAEDKSKLTAMLLDEKVFFVPVGTEVIVKDSSEYGRFVEFGQRNGWVMKTMLQPPRF